MIKLVPASSAESSPSLRECQESSQTLRELSSSPKAHGPHSDDDDDDDAENGDDDDNDDHNTDEELSLLIYESF